MFPYIEKQIGLYPKLALIGFLSAGILACACTRKKHKDENDTIVFFLLAALGAPIGSHLLHGLLNINLIITGLSDITVIDSVQKFFEVLLIRKRPDVPQIFIYRVLTFFFTFQILLIILNYLFC